MELKRMNSLCPSPPEHTLLKLVKLNSLASIRTVVEKDPDILRYEYQHPYFKTLLQIACSGDVVAGIKPETIDILLELGADRYACTETNKVPAWQFAAVSGRPEILKRIFRGFNRDRINAVSNGNTALHWVIKNIKSRDDIDGALECIKLLVEHGIDINRTDNKNSTAILLAAEKGYEDIVKCLINKSDGQIDLDTHHNRKKQSARNIIENNKLYQGDLPKHYMAPIKSRKEQLDEYLKNNQEFEFIKCLEQEEDTCQREELCNSNNGNSTYLQYSCEQDLRDTASTLLKRGANPNKVVDSNPKAPIIIAAERGNYEICEFLLGYDETHIPEDLVSLTIISLPRARNKEESHKRYVERLLARVESVQIDVCNHQDWKKSTPLHYACRYGNQDLILELLNRGASLACRNDFDQLAVADISAATLKKHLDNCIEIPKNESALEPFVTVTYNYKSLVPPPRKSMPSDNETAIDIDKQGTNLEAFIPPKGDSDMNLVPEMDVVMYITESCELRGLLKHPVITSFLYMKWYRIQTFFYTNLAFYLAFCMALILYILFFFSNSEEQPILKCVVFILFLMLVIRELFQFIVAPKLYVINVENWIEISLIIVTSFILGLEKPPQDTCKQFSAVGILLAAIELILLIGQHPIMAENVTMLRTVSKNFFKFLVWYSILIIAFALSFFTLFNKPKDQTSAEDDNNTTDKKEEETDFFVDPVMSVFKTIVMLTGEFDASDLDFNTYPLASRAIFILFVFMIAIVLFNLLNGLAVSDTQTIRNDAQLVTQIARARHIAYYEKILMGSIMPRNIINCIKRCLFSCVKDENNSMPVRCNCFARMISLFPKFLPQYKLTVLMTNKDCQVIDPTHEKKNKVGLSDKNAENNKRKYWNIRLDTFTAEETHVWLQNKKANDGNESAINSILEMLTVQQRSIEDLKNTLSTLISDKTSD